MHTLQMLPALVLLSILSMAICYRIAKSRSADRWFWALAGLLLGPVAIPFAFFARAEEARRKPPDA